MISELKNRLSGKKVWFDYDVSTENSMGVGGRVAAFITAENIGEVEEIYRLARSQKLGFMVIGEGTNVVFNEGFINLLVLKLGKGFRYVHITGNRIEAGGGCNLGKFVVEAARQGYDFSALAGIPGSVGGAVYGNSGNICSYVKAVDGLFEKGLRDRIEISEGDYVYRQFRTAGLKAILSVQFKQKHADSNIIFSRIRNQIKEKKKSQPLKERSAGCFFKNPAAAPAGKLIEECGLKGLRYGGAAVSAKHANFLINLDNASAEDVYVLSRIINDLVYYRYNIRLENEVNMIGFKNAGHS
ncbi:MAG: UDP-N-acetylmuramate dehydrogenase [Actinomycetota bacterium]